MYLFKCDICKKIQEENEKFYNISETTRGDRKISLDICSKCAEPIINFKNNKKKEGE